MSMSSIRSEMLRNFGNAVGFQEDGPDKAGSVPKNVECAWREFAKATKTEVWQLQK